MATVKKSTGKSAPKARSAQAAKKSHTPKAKKTHRAALNKVDYYPNRMTFWVSAAAGSLITLIAIICVYNR